ncbi:MAG: HAMP domain-containing histidine kinase [Cyanobacteria bacterium SZAS-4]|nr:HAMP domain-containing histidine kinase [Cyanobacteria bacterium SZAS-4]
MNIPKFLPKLKLIHSGLILVSVPLLFGFIITCGLNSELQQAFQQRRNIERRAIASVTISKLVQDCIEFKSDLIATDANLHLNKTADDRLNNDVKKVHADLDKLVELSASSKNYTVMLADSMPTANDATAEVDRVAETVKDGEIDKNTSRSNLLQLETVIEKLKKVAQAHADTLPTDPAAAKVHDRMVQQFLAWLIAANILVCPLIVLYFSQNVVRRLLVLVANAERLAHDKELLKPVGGDDEIAHLDKVFRLMAETITKTRAEREEAERVKKEFVAMIGHDLRTPLSSVQGTLTLLADGIYGDISEVGIKKARVAEKSIERITHLANELLDIEKIESNNLQVELEAIALKDAIERSIANLEGFAVYKKIEIAFAGTNLEVMADEARLTQVLVNLISNAIKFSPDGSTVSIIAHQTEAGQVEVRVSDQGRGISADKKEEIFARYKQLDKTDAKNERGIGLGLAICKAIVENHGGQIGVDSNEAGGCSFWIRIASATQQKIRLETREKVS